MKKLGEWGRKIRDFWGEVVTELKKCSWPERRELVESTVAVIMLVLLLSAFVGVSDKVLVSVLKLLIPAG